MSTSIQRSGSTISLSVGGRSVRFEAANASFVKSALARFLQTGGGTRTEQRGAGEVVVSKGGGTDYEPKVWISSESDDGGSRGSVWLTEDDARAAHDAL